MPHYHYHITKLLLRIIIARIRRPIKPEISDEQFGFVEGKGTSNAIYTIRNVIERGMEKQKDIYICFIDYSKAFDRVKHSHLIEILKNVDIDKTRLETDSTYILEKTSNSQSRK